MILEALQIALAVLIVGLPSLGLFALACYIFFYFKKKFAPAPSNPNQIFVGKEVTEKEESECKNSYSSPTIKEDLPVFKKKEKEIKIESSFGGKRIGKVDK